MKVLSISTSRPTLEINSTRAQMEIKNTVRRHFTMKRTPPEMHVTNVRPKMKVNWKQVWAHKGLRSPEYQRKYQTERSKQKVYDYIAKKNSDAAFLGAIEEYAFTDVNRVGQLAYQEMMYSDIPEINVAQPNPLPEVEWDKGTMKIEWTPGDIEIVWENEFRPQISVTPHSVEIRLNGHPEVKITVNENGVSKNSGKKVDKKV